MSLTDQERKLVRRSLRMFAAQNDVKTLAFSRIVPWLAVARPCSIVPRLSAQTIAEFRSLIRATDFSLDHVNRAYALVVADALPNISGLVVTAESCPLMENDGTTTCQREAGQPGCDACAGRRYYAKTDGVTVWIAADVLSSANRFGGAEFLNVGNVYVSSMAEFVLLHEFAHVMQGNGVTFATSISMYNDARAEIPATLQTRVQSGDGDALEFAANSFAYECTRSDRSARPDC